MSIVNTPKLEPTFKVAEATDRNTLIALLRASNLPVDDLPEDLSSFILAFIDNRLVGSAGLESYGRTALLRSVTVAPEFRNRLLGRQLIEHIRTHAHQAGIHELFLITTSADQYFEKLGFNPIDRRKVPATIAATQQFTGICPTSAVVMNAQL